jgi:hypothetical protein
VSDLKDFIVVSFWLVLAVAAILALAVGVSYPFSKRSCRETWQASGMASDFGIWTGCMVRLPDGTWVPAESYRPVKEVR